MIQYVKCSEISDDFTYEGHEISFRDYIIPHQLDKAKFIEMFFGPEGNQRDLSYIALKDGKPVGVVLGGMKNLDGVPTMRCGSLGVSKEMRGTGIAQELMSRLEKEAKDRDCKQVFLEVIVGNDRAIKFYKKLGYKKIYDISYYAIPKKELLKNIKGTNNEISIEKIDFKHIEALRRSLKSLHMSWQSDIEYFKDLPCSHYGAFLDGKLIGAISYSKSRIFFLWVEESYRLKYVSDTLLKEMCKTMEAEMISTSSVNNASFQSYCIHKGMKENDLHQYEMYKWL